MALDSPPDVRTDALHLLSNGIYVLTACVGETMHVAAVTWVTQVSFRPPLVLVALQRNSRLAEAVRKAHRFALNILGADQAAVAERFFHYFTAPQLAEQALDQPVRLSPGHCPLLTDTLAWVECRVAAEPATPGDHSLILGEVSGSGVRQPGKPLVLGDTAWSYGGLKEGDA